MNISACFPPDTIRVRISELTDGEPFAEFAVDCLMYTKDDDETTESVLVRVLTDIENKIVEVCKKHSPRRDDTMLHQDAADGVKYIYPMIQSMIRKLKRRTINQRELNLKNLKKELNLK